MPRRLTVELGDGVADSECNDCQFRDAEIGGRCFAFGLLEGYRGKDKTVHRKRHPDCIANEKATAEVRELARQYTELCESTPAEEAIRARTDDPRELAAQLVGELVRRGYEPTVAQWAHRSVHITILEEAPWIAITGSPMRMSLGNSNVGLLKGSSVPYDHDAALAHLMGK